MSISISTLKCPVCLEQLLETVSAPLGIWDRCPSCKGLFLSQEIIAAASQDRAKCLEALEETKVLLLPTDRACPKCFQNLFDGRVKSRGVILSVCPPCQSFWTSLPILAQFEAFIEKTLRMQMEEAGTLSNGSGAGSGAFAPSADTMTSRFFRVFARLFDRVADEFTKDPAELALEEEEPKKPAKEPRPSKTKKEPPPPLIKKVEALPPESKPKEPPKLTMPEPELPPPQLDIPEFIFPEEPVVEKEEETPEPLPTPAPEPKPEPKKIEPQPKLEPKPAPVPEPKPEPAPQPEPKPVPQSAKAPAPVAQIKVKKPGIFAQFKAAWSPKPKKSIPTVKPAEPAKVAKPVKVTQPVAPIKAPVAPKPKKEKPPKEPVDRLATWPPWALGALAVALSSFRDFGFEGVPAVLWGFMGWSIGMMVRLSRMYPFKPFQDMSLQTLADSKGISGVRAIPVILKGQIIPEREADPKGPVVFKQEERTIALNRLKRWDVIPRLFGLSNPRQLLKGEVVLKGWYRAGLVPFIEVQEVRADKASRKSMTRLLRWVFVALVFLIAFVIYLSLD
jgi:hypothetical protein